MKAFIYEKYGSAENLNLAEIEKPQPKENELLIKVEAVSLNAADKFLLSGKPLIARAEFGLLKPKRPILGSDVAGRVEAVGKNVTQFEVGDNVFADLSGDGLGGFAEYVCATADIVAKISDEVPATQAAALPMSSVTALQALRKGNVQAGQSVLVYGASGGVGTFAVQIAKALGAEVTGVCSTSKVELVRSLGADHVIDYKREDFTQNGKKYDLILAVNGFRPIPQYKSALTPTGTVVVIGGAMRQIFGAMILGPVLSKKNGQTITGILAKPNSADLTIVAEMLVAEKLAPVIDKYYPFNELPAAMRYMESGRAKGKVIIKVAEAKRI